MDEESVNRLNSLIDSIPITDENEELVEQVKEDIKNKDFDQALEKLDQISKMQNKPKKQQESNENKTKKEDNKAQNKSEKKIVISSRRGNISENDEDKGPIYPPELSNIDLEHVYMGLLLSDPKQIVKYYFLYDECYFEDASILNIYKSVLFTEGGRYTPEVAKEGFNFSKDSEEVFRQKESLKRSVAGINYDMEKVYIELKKLFILRKNYLAIPIKNIQDEVVEITKYKLYNKMSVDEVKSAIVQVNDTEKFKRSILNVGLTSFLERGDNNLTNGLPLPFPILTEIFKGIRKGETMAFAMPSNAGKSRFTIDLAAHVALVHKKKVLVISNEMSEEKMKLCFITTILNNEEIQKIHGQNLKISEGELLEFKFRPDDPKKVKVDEDGYVLKEEGESQLEFSKRLLKVSEDFRKVIAVTDWANKQLNNSIYFINITDHTNDELRKVIMNYYYKYQIEYVFYDTLKTDTANIGIGEELKKTATILSNLAQNFGIYICSTLQLSETQTLPVNLTVNDLAVSKTVKEVLDTLCLLKQINRSTLQNYEYSLKEVDTKFYDLKKYSDPDVRYYSCVVDKNRAGAKPTLVFRLNLAYNVWEELGYLRLKQSDEDFIDRV